MFSNQTIGRAFIKTLTRPLLMDKLSKYRMMASATDFIECIVINTNKCPKSAPVKLSAAQSIGNDLRNFPKSCCVRRSFAKDPCAGSNKDDKDKKKKQEVEYKSAWGEPLPQPDREPQVIRYDSLYYDDSLKDRLFQKTWIDCPSPVVVNKKFCCTDISPPNLGKPTKDMIPKTAGPIDPRNQSKPGCGDECPRIGAAHCRPARNPPRCVQTATPSDCTKIETPYPAFSECSREQRQPKMQRECDCGTPPMLCEVNEHLEKYLAEMKEKNRKG